MDGSNLRQSARACTRFLTTALDRDWDEKIPEMDWTVRQVVAHIATTLLWYAVDLSAGPKELSTLELSVRPTEEPESLVATLTTAATVLGHIVDSVQPGHRGWHPAGMADASGFAAMGCDELLVHTYDAARGLGLEFDPPTVLSTLVLRRLFPSAPVETDSWQTLLWANGRMALEDRPRQAEWHPHPAPLNEPLNE